MKNIHINHYWKLSNNWSITVFPSTLGNFSTSGVGLGCKSRKDLETWDMCSFWEIVLLSQDFRINYCFIVQQQLVMWANFVSVCVVFSLHGKVKSHNRKKNCREASQVLTTTQNATAAIFSAHACIFFTRFLCIKDNLFMMKSLSIPLLCKPTFLLVSIVRTRRVIASCDVPYASVSIASRLVEFP